MAALVVVAVLALSGTAAPSALAATGSISGTITGAPSHAPVGEVEVCATKVQKGENFETKDHCSFSGSNGHYEIDNLGEGEYLVVFWPRGQDQNYIPDTYDPDGHWPGEPVTVGTGPVTGIDTELPEGGSIKGQVTDEAGGEPLAGVTVCATESWESRGEPRCDVTGVDGHYLIVGLLNLEYTVEFSATKGGLHYFDERWQDQIVGSGYPQTLVPVTEGHVTSGIDAALKPSAEVRGVASAAADGRGLGHILVCVAPPKSFSEDQFFDRAKCERTDGSGSYSIGNLEAGQYTVAFSLELREFVHWLPPLEPEEDGYPTRYWKEKDTLWEADVLTLNAPTVATGIDARLGPPAPAAIAAPSAPPAVLSVHRLIHRPCKHGFKHRKVKGKYRCVKDHRRQSRHRPRHRHPSRPPAVPTIRSLGR